MNHTDDRQSPASTRREFCVRTCEAVSLLTLGAALPACGGSTTSPSLAPALPSVAGTLVNRTLTVTIDAASPLALVGGAATVQVTTGTYLVARTAQSAVHRGDRRLHARRLRQQPLRLPCHGSEFSTSGSVVKGPAVSALRQFPATFAGNVVTISV